ncbi:hypothetical protein [Sphingomonas sp.]|uniref:hypothetical protein n=1 Tax=Sphingomonas sp. TaxID=28214 RepID=UPI00307EA729
MQRPFVVDPVLTAIAIGYRNPSSSYIADAVSPRVSVAGETFKWMHYPLEESFNVPDGRVGRRGQVQQLEFGGEEREASVEDFGFDVPIPNSDIEAAKRARAQKLSNFDPEAHAVQSIADTLLNVREVRVARQFQTAANFASGRKITLSGSSQLSHVDSDPIGVIKAGMDATLVFRPTDLAMGRAVWSKLSSHPKIVNAVKGGTTTSGMVTLEQFLELFAGEGLKRIHIGDAWYNTAKPGQAVSLSRAWGKHMTLFHQNPVANAEGGGVTFALTAALGSKVAGRIEDPDIGLQGGFRIRNGERVKELLPAPDVGYFIENAVA